MHFPLTQNRSRGTAHVRAARYIRHMLEGFLGWHVAIIVGVLLVPAAVVALAVALVRRMRRD